MPDTTGAAASAVTLDALFDERGTERLRYSARCAHLSGSWVEFDTHVSRSHEGSSWLAVEQPGACPDCSPVPVAALQLPGFELPAALDSAASLRLRGRLCYGFEVDDEGRASFLRLQDAQIVAIEGKPS